MLGASMQLLGAPLLVAFVPIVKVIPNFVIVLLPSIILFTYTWVWLLRQASQTILKLLQAELIASDSQKGLRSVVANLCTTHGLMVPKLCIIDSEAVNSTSIGMNAQSAFLILTSGALAKLDRLELETVVAYELLRIQQNLGEITILANVARLPGSSFFITRMLRFINKDHTETDADIAAIRMTRYPPALASVLLKIKEAPEIETAPALAHLWLAIPESHPIREVIQPPIDVRIDFLGEL